MLPYFRVHNLFVFLLSNIPSYGYIVVCLSTVGLAVNYSRCVSLHSSLVLSSLCPQGGEALFCLVRLKDTYLILFWGWNLVSCIKLILGHFFFLLKHTVWLKEKVLFVPHLCRILTGWSWSSYLISLCLCFLVWAMQRMTVLTALGYEHRTS